MVDAEYTYMNPGISVGALAMMLALNRDGQAVVANTYQCYLKDALNTLKQESDIILGNDCMFGMNNFPISISKNFFYLKIVHIQVQKLSAVLTWRKRGCAHLSRDTLTQSMTHTRTPASCMTGT